MNIVSRFLHSSLGKKYVMAVTGAGLFGFVVMHLLGNLQVFLGPEAINAYGHFLQSKPEIVWTARVGLLAMVGFHIWGAITLSAQNKAARPVAYADFKPVAASYASRTMLMSGLIIAAFIIYHLLHFTVQTKQVNLKGVDFHGMVDAAGRHDVYNMMMVGFSHPVVSLFYIIAIALLCLHLSHGLSSMFQSMGWKNKKYGRCLDRVARITAIVLFLGYASIPAAIMAGVIKPQTLPQPIVGKP